MDEIDATAAERALSPVRITSAVVSLVPVFPRVFPARRSESIAENDLNVVRRTWKIAEDRIRALFVCNDHVARGKIINMNWKFRRIYIE